jgi:type I restriction enzyme S subunit
MIDRLKPYPAMKDSGLPWLGDVPTDWRVLPVRRLLRARDGIKIGPFGSQLKLEHMVSAGYKVYGQANVITADFAKGSKFIDDEKFQGLRECEICPGDLVMTMMGTGGRCAVVPDGAAIGLMDSHLLRLRMDAAILPEFAALVIDQASYAKQQIDLVSKGSIMQGLNSGIVKDLLLAVPPLLDQRAIVDFLRYMDRRIWRYIRAKQKLIKLLEQQTQATIYRAVTRGLDPDVRLKPAGVEWLGKLPDHWGVVELRRLVSFVTSGSRSWAAHYSDSGDIFLQSGNLGRSMGLNLSFVQHVRPPRGAEGERTSVRRDDVLVCITGALTGNVALVDVDLPGQAFVSQHVALLRPKPTSVYPRYLAFVLHSEIGRIQFKANEYGGTKQGLGLHEVELALVPMPPVAEQHRICEALEIRLRGLTTGTRGAKREIDLLREYRTRLIADVVTGKLDVREAAARLPDAGTEVEVEDEEALSEEDDGSEDEDIDDRESANAVSR